MSVIKIDLDKIPQLVEKGGDIILDPDASSELFELLKIQHQINSALDEAKEKIKEKALEYNANFSSVLSDKIRIMYRSYGSKYSIDKGRIGEIPKELYKTSYRVKTEELEEYAKEHGLPLGIVENEERSKSISISVRHKEDLE